MSKMHFTGKSLSFMLYGLVWLLPKLFGNFIQTSDRPPNHTLWHGLRKPNEGINLKNLEIWANL